MKCQNCGKNEANFHYMENVNGSVTEAHLCNECAEKAGYTNNVFAGVDRMFDSMMSDFFRIPSLIGMSPFVRRPMLTTSPSANASYAAEQRTVSPEIDRSADGVGRVDPEFSKRREINALKAQMYSAVQAEEFEKAAELRDRIKGMEKTE